MFRVLHKIPLNKGQQQTHRRQALYLHGKITPQPAYAHKIQLEFIGFLFHSFPELVAAPFCLEIENNFAQKACQNIVFTGS